MKNKTQDMFRIVVSPTSAKNASSSLNAPLAHLARLYRFFLEFGETLDCDGFSNKL